MINCYSAGLVFFPVQSLLTLKLMLSYLLYIYPEHMFDIFLCSSSGFGSSKLFSIIKNQKFSEKSRHTEELIRKVLLKLLKVITHEFKNHF